MRSKIVLLVCVLFLGTIAFTPPLSAAGGASPCYIMYDAGSSGTRLYIYENRGDEWLEHAGPKVSALADPVREINGKDTWDIEAVTTEVVSALDGIKQDGPMKEGKPKWKAFDWSRQCNLVSADVYATAGMRIAEQENRDSSEALWKSLKKKLKKKVGETASVDTRTITGFEEGLYAWLTVREDKKRDNFGIVEMGGASSQVTFPCPDCANTTNAVRTVMLEGKPLKIYSYSFLGLGQDEAPKSLGLPPSCAYGIGLEEPGWTSGECTDRITVMNDHSIRDPYNYKGDKRGTGNLVPVKKARVENWFLTGAFNYMKDGEFADCCLEKGDCFGKDTSCFRTLYLRKYLRALHIPPSSGRMDVSWTRGAVICEVEDCLSKTEPPICRWTNEGCL